MQRFSPIACGAVIALAFATKPLNAQMTPANPFPGGNTIAAPGSNWPGSPNGLNNLNNPNNPKSPNNPNFVNNLLSNPFGMGNTAPRNPNVNELGGSTFSNGVNGTPSTISMNGNTSNGTNGNPFVWGSGAFPVIWGGGFPYAGGMGGGIPNQNAIGFVPENAVPGSLVEYEYAQRMHIENVIREIQAYRYLRSSYDDWLRQQSDRSRHSPEVLALAAAAEVPRALSSNELDPATGQIAWPEVLLGREYALMRSELEQLFHDRALSTIGADTVRKIREDTATMLEILRSNIETMPAGDYIAARKFIEGLDYVVVAHH